MDITRNLHGKNFVYKSKGGETINDPDTIERINSLAIPPAYKNVQIASSQRNYLQAKGEDQMGRTQYIYNKKFIAKQSKNKYCQLKHFGDNIKQIRSWISVNLGKDLDDKKTILALALYLIDNCYFRIGNMDYYHKYKSFGVTTLQKQHVKFEGKKMIIDFIGKKGVQNKCEISSQKVVEVFRKLLSKVGGKTDFIFQYQGGQEKSILSANDVNIFLKGYNPDITVKMFRTWGANHHFLIEMKKRKSRFLELGQVLDLKKKEKMENGLIKEIMVAISEKLHNTPAVCRKSYLDNNLIKIYTNDRNKFWSEIDNFHSGNFQLLLVKFLKGNCPTIKKTKKKRMGGGKRKKSLIYRWFGSLI